MYDSHLRRITRKIEIDAAHRVPDHASKCKNLHGHRYVVEATCVGGLIQSGPEAGMVMDFGFLKEVMVDCIDKFYDHAMIAWENDPLIDDIRKLCTGMKLMILPVIPTAENLAQVWFDADYLSVRIRSNGNAKLESVRVWETPNCWADYPVR